MSENGRWRPLPRPGREGPPPSSPGGEAGQLHRRREQVQLTIWGLSGAVLGILMAIAVCALLEPAARPPAGSEPVLLVVDQRLSPACAETLQGCPTYADR